jgi:3-hydroxyisobutyrate dehydrogenase
MEGGHIMPDSAMRVGFIGIGRMGSRMARRLVDAGCAVMVYNRSRPKTAPLADAGASVADTPRALGETSDVVMLSLPDDAAVRVALLGPDGALAGMRAGSVIIDLSTVMPETSRTVFEASRSKGVAMLDAPVSGSTPQAEQGRLLIFVGGEHETYARWTPILEHLGRHEYMGSTGMGATMKLVVNSLLGLGIQALAEAVALAEKAGLDTGRFLEVLGETSVISPSQKSKLDNVRRADYSPTFPVRLMFKDFGLALRLAESLSVPMPATAVAQQLCAVEQARAQEEDFSVIVQRMRELSGADAEATG